MRGIWSFGLFLALAGCVSASHRRDRIEASSGRIGTYTYNDVLRPHGRARGEAEEQVATRICDGGNWHRIGRPDFDACMRAHGWRLASFKPAPEPEAYSPSPSIDSTPSTPSGPDLAQQTADANAAMAAAQAQNDAANAATVQTEFQFNTIYANPNPNW